MTFERHSDRRASERGVTIVESAVILIMFFSLLFGIIEAGRFLNMRQVLTNAAREGARIAAADPTLVTQLGGSTTLSCAAPCSGQPNVLQVTAARLSNVLLKTTNVTLTYPASGAGTCNQMLAVQVQGTYNYFFYQLLHLLKITNDLNTVTITRTTTMRYEHQTPCNPWS